MTLAFDINPLLYASDRRSPFHAVARSWIDSSIASGELIYLFWPVAVGYVRLSTGSAIAHSPLSLTEAVENVGALLSQPHVRTPNEGDGFWAEFSRSSTQAQARGKIISDVHIVALMRQHGVRRILTHDRDFRKFDGIEVVDPFV